MIVVVTGSRGLAQHPERLLIKSRFLTAITELNPFVVHQGGAAGPDTWAGMEFNDIQRHHPPSRTNTRTPAQRLFDRNVTMINAALSEGETIMVTCWDGESKGTKHAIDYAESLGIPMLHTHWNSQHLEERNDDRQQ